MTNIPKKIFIVPYRNRPEQKFFFCKYMKFLLEHTTDYEIYFSHQTDKRSFNRGATRNIGFLAMKAKYPNHYKEMTFIFNDLDTIPFNRIFDYETHLGMVKHYYGFTHSLGGIVVFKGADFEKINGYPNFWSWGREDACLQKRCQTAGIAINRQDFYTIGSPEILQLFDGVGRIINTRDPHKLDDDVGATGLTTIRKLEYVIEKKSTNELDNIYDALGQHFNYINIISFQTETQFEDDEYYKYDLREPVSNIMNPDPRKRTRHVDTKPAEWKSIPYYPTTNERKEQQQQPQQQPQQRPRQIVENRPNAMTPPPPQPMQKPQPLEDTLPNARPQSTPTSFRQLRQQNVHMFPPKSISSAGGTSAINKINLRYRMAKI